MKAQLLVETAQRQLGYQALPGGGNVFMSGAGYGSGLIWDGAFVDWTINSSHLNTAIRHIQPAVALQYYLSHGLTVKRPRPGDLVFLATSPRVRIGIASDTSIYSGTGRLKVIQGQVSSGLPRASTEEDGVHTRTRCNTEVLAFARPRLYTEIVLQDTHRLPLIVPAQLTTGGPATAVALVQLALQDTVGLRDHFFARFDGPTKTAYAVFQGQHGLTMNGVPDKESLDILSEKTRIFRTQ